MALTEKFDIIIPPQNIDEDPQCLSRIASGDEQSFAWLYKNYCKRVYDYLLLLTTDQKLAEDIVQDVFLKIWTNREMLSSISNFNAYVHTCAKNRLINFYEKKAHEKIYLEDLKRTGVLCVEENSIIRKEQRQRIYQAMQSLTKRQQQVYHLIREEGRSRKEAGAVLEVSEFTVKNTMKNALKVLREKIGKRED